MYLQVQALKIAYDDKHNDFNASNGYLKKFKKRNKVVLITIYGEAGSVDCRVKSLNKVDDKSLFKL